MSLRIVQQLKAKGQFSSVQFNLIQGSRVDVNHSICVTMGPWFKCDLPHSAVLLSTPDI